MEISKFSFPPTNVHNLLFSLAPLQSRSKSKLDAIISRAKSITIIIISIRSKSHNAKNKMKNFEFLNEKSTTGTDKYHF